MTLVEILKEQLLKTLNQKDVKNHEEHQIQIDTLMKELERAKFEEAKKEE